MSQSDSEDIRVNHISISAQQIMAFGSNEWEETFQKEENKTLIKDFLDTITSNILLIYFDTTEKLVFSSEIKNSNLPLPKRLCFFLKNRKAVSMANYKQEIIFGNLSDFPLNQYQNLFKKVLMPIFCNPSNSQRWPIEIAHDINSHIKDFQTDLLYQVGLAEQKTVLMVPDKAKLIENYDQDQISKQDCRNQEFQNIMHSITEMLSNWIPIVQEVLEFTTEQVILQVDQDPTTEISFWNDRKEQLEFIYSQSKYYKSVPSQIIVLLKKICYILYKKTHKFLDPLSLFTVSRDKAIENIKTSIDIMSVFLNSYDDCREYFHSLDNKTEIYPWKFPDKRVFSQFEILVQRLKEILDIISAAETYFNIPVNKLFKMQQAEYRKRLENIQSQFTQEFKVFEKCTYDPLDLNSNAFPEDYISFLNKVKELDIQIGITIGQVSLLCDSFEEASQIMNTFEDIIKRPFANKEFQKLASLPILNVSQEFLNVKDNYDSLAHRIEHFDDLIVYNNLPHISGVVQWTLDQQNKLSFPMKSLKEFSENIENKDNESVVAKYKKIYDHPKEFEKYLADKCKIRIASVNSKLDQEVLKTVNRIEIFVNFHSQMY
ncbi:hypothetical protein JTE90_014106 [Oedothorax gibbosus]|uniref:Dynein heavy chain tail domain-containing protein n=1 Tax=Oedothorax gibbosus TaxID=931172 RepID=A0AAV6V837_9ARAC|nr:hypothetical protein JTE90_014106 [Oedothorax gibbosus]